MAADQKKKKLNKFDVHVFGVVRLYADMWCVCVCLANEKRKRKMLKQMPSDVTNNNNE